MAVIKKDARGGRGTYATLAQVVNYVDEQGFDLQGRPSWLTDACMWIRPSGRRARTSGLPVIVLSRSRWVIRVA